MYINKKEKGENYKSLRKQLNHEIENIVRKRLAESQLSSVSRDILEDAVKDCRENDREY